MHEPNQVATVLLRRSESSHCIFDERYVVLNGASALADSASKADDSKEDEQPVAPLGVGHQDSFE